MHCFGLFGLPLWYRKVMLRQRRTLQAVRPRRGAVLGRPRVWGRSGWKATITMAFQQLKKGPCHDLPRINGKVTRNTMKYWDNSWFVASDIWFFRFVLCIPPDYVKPLKRIDWKQDTLPIWWLKQGRLRSSANYVFTIFLEKDIQSLQMPEHDFPIDPLSSSLLSWAEVFGEAKQQKREEVGPWIGR